MQLETVTSSAIHAVGYDPDRRVLEVIFSTGRIYQFVGVPPDEYKSFREAESKGQYFNSNIRDAYPFWSFHAARQPRTRDK